MRNRMANSLSVPARGSLCCAAIASLLFCGAPERAIAQFAEVVAAEDTSQQPGDYGFQVEIDETLQTAFTDFERHAGRMAWEKAFQALNDIPREQRSGMLEDENGYLIGARQRIWNALVSLPAEGREAFRIFFEPRAENLFAELEDRRKEDPAGARNLIEEIYDQYFLTSVGDNAADLLGDARFEQGQYDAAVNCWTAILDHHPNSEIPEVRLLVKRALALGASGRAGEFETARRQITQRYGSARVLLGGSEVVAAEFLEGVRVSRETEDRTADVLPAGAPQGDVEPVWQVQFLSDRGNKLLTEAITNNYYYRTGMETYVPVTATDGERLYCNWFGLCFAIDLETGKLLWRTEKFTQMYDRFANMQQTALDFESFSISAMNGVVLAVSVPADQMRNWQPLNRLTVHDAETGAVKWTSQSLAPIANTSFTGRPLVVGDHVYALTHDQGQTDLTLRKLSLADGQVLFSQKLGMAQGRQDNWRGNTIMPSPNLLLRGDRLFVLANSGALVEFDLKSQTIASILRFKKPAGGEGQSRIYYYAPLDEATALHTKGALFAQDGLLYFKERGGTALYALDPSARRFVWQRPADDSSQLVAIDADNCYMLSRELMCIDRRTRNLKWAVALPVEGGGLSAVPTSRGILVFTSRGIFEVDRETGDIARIFRGNDLASIGGALDVHGQQALCVSNRSITMYPLTDSAQEVSSSESAGESEAAAGP